ncbi:S-methyl-5-thioribose-1-phosphate isomerase [Candidatus Bipolaricaulota bacterium]|nr:S-methyl-5-thioribose-1-phosphate isomerase [Candidatus Bipolaricaulota bacterium]
MLTPITFHDGVIELIDQTRLPQGVVTLTVRDYRELAAAIREMRVRGAPAIGIAAAYGVVLGIQALTDGAVLDEHFKKVIEELTATRPTARNLFWALERMTQVFRENRDTGLEFLRETLLDEAKRIHEEDIEANKRIGSYGAKLIPDGATILTHCNAGALATGGYGTALGIVRAAWEAGKLKKVLVDETRPRLQGARLTAWELKQDGIPFELITDSMAGSFMACGEVDAVVVGADRIARNGDTANKIGTYPLAVLAHHHKVPFYVAAPTSTVDPTIRNGSQIPIEERDPSEVTQMRDVRIAPEGVNVRNPSFDVTPAGLITAIVTEQGVFRSPLSEAIENVLHG